MIRQGVENMEKMKALVFLGNGTTELQERNIPILKDENDAIVKVTLSTICTSDLHIVHGFVQKAKSNIILGHEFVGVVTKTGKNVKHIKVGDRVSANCVTNCGKCWYCQHNFVNNCENGGWQLGCTIDGCQAEYVRVPYADSSLYKIPNNLSDKSALFTGDILASGYFGAQLCEIKKGYTVAVIGSGPVGICSAMCAKLLGAEKVIIIDIDSERLKFAEKNNVADNYIDSSKQDVIQSVLNLTKMRGADAVIEAAGNDETFKMSWQIARANAIVAVVAMYEKPLSLPLNQMYGKNLIFKTGGVDSAYCDEILQYLANGKINTDFLITHSVNLNNIEKGYKIFEEKKDGCMKIAVTPYEYQF